MKPETSDRGIHASLHFCGTIPRGAEYFQGVGVGISFQNAARQGRRARAYMDVSVRRIGTAILKRNTNVHTLKVIGTSGDSSAKVKRGMDAAVRRFGLQAIPWMD
ncbi:MAG: hypothetical protein KJP11_09540, partial [Gammaproteobacteria bacterium]|nr:hypothetical protein [Gammaproteobacteria bacterium]